MKNYQEALFKFWIYLSNFKAIRLASYRLHNKISDIWSQPEGMHPVETIETVSQDINWICVSTSFLVCPLAILFSFATELVVLQNIPTLVDWIRDETNR